jgi:hypothetical protein
MKFRYALVTLVAFAGFGASLALADGGHGQNGNGNCKHGVVFGTLSAPQSLTVTVVKANGQSGFSAGQTVTVNVGAAGSQVRLAAEGCVGTDGTLTVREAELHARNPNAGNHQGGDHGGQSTNEQTTSTDSTPGTTTDAQD